MNAANKTLLDARTREAVVMLQVYDQLPFVSAEASDCNLVTIDGQHILNFWDGNAVALDIRATTAELLVEIAPKRFLRDFFVNSDAEANESALRLAFITTTLANIKSIM